MNTTTYIASNTEAGYTIGHESADKHGVWLIALGDAFNAEFRFERDADGYMQILDSKGTACFLAGSFKADDAEAQQACIHKALEHCGDRGLRGREIMELVRDDAGTLVDVDPSIDMDDRADWVTYWAARL